MEEFIPTILFSLLLIEVLLLLFWVRPYFRKGIPVYIKNIEAPMNYESPFDSEYLSQQMRSAYTCNFYFTEFSSTDCGFREKLWEIKLFNYFPVMRGMLKVDSSKNSLKVVGFLNWYVLFFLFSAIWLDPNMVSTVILFTSIFYIAQFYRFKKLVKVLSKRGS